MLTLLEIISIGFAVLSAGLWLRSAKVPLKLKYSQDEPFVLDLKALTLRAMRKLPARPHAMTRIVVRRALQIIRMLRLGFPEGTGAL
jgi:hypothetical protein